MRFLYLQRINNLTSVQAYSSSFNSSLRKAFRAEGFYYHNYSIADIAPTYLLTGAPTSAPSYEVRRLMSMEATSDARGSYDFSIIMFLFFNEGYTSTFIATSTLSTTHSIAVFDGLRSGFATILSYDGYAELSLSYLNVTLVKAFDLPSKFSLPSPLPTSAPVTVAPTPAPTILSSGYLLFTMVSSPTCTVSSASITYVTYEGHVGLIFATGVCAC